MPPGKRRQSNAMLYTLITFVALFVAATTVAVIYYVKAEELRTTAKDAQEDLSNMASDEEVRNVGTIVGTRLRGETNLGSMLQYFDQMTGLVMGTPVAETSAEAKVSTVKDATVKLLQGVKSFITLPPGDPNSPDPSVPDPNQVSVMTVANDLTAALERVTGRNTSLTNDLQKLQQRFDDATAKWGTTEQELTAKVDGYKKQVEQTKSDYANLRTLLEQSSEQRAANLLKQVEDLRTGSRKLNEDLNKTQAELSLARQRLADALDTIKKTQPDPNERAVAGIPDGKIILVDEAAGVVQINLGSDDRIYRGLTFSVYDRASGVSADDTPKAEIEVFAIKSKTAAARITSSERSNPIATGDIIANLIWDKDKSNQFVIVGSFDLNGDGQADFDAKDRLTMLIRKWGGTVTDTVSAKTDYVIIGTEPTVPPEPTFEQLTADPEARTRFERAKAQATRYDEILQKAQTFYIPTLPYERFLYLIGYTSQVDEPGAF